MEEKDIFKYLENEVRAANTLKAAKEAYQADLEKHLENEVRAQHTLQAAKVAYEKDLEKHLENEIRAKHTLETAKRASASVEGGKAAAGKSFTITWTRYIASAAAACFLGVFIFQGVDEYNTEKAGNAMYAYYSESVTRDGNTIDEQIANKEYEQALISIDEELSLIPEGSEFDNMRVRLLEQKAIVLLLQGERKEAAAILKSLKTESAEKALETLWWWQK